jgi:hypothetical protein
MGIFSFPNPVEMVEGITDEALKRAAIETATSLVYSQYITLLYTLGKALAGKKFIGWLGGPLITMAASAFVMLVRQDCQKLFYMSVPAELVNDQKLRDSIWWEKQQLK